MPVADGITTLSNSIYAELTTDLSLDLPALPDLTGADYSIPSETNNPLYSPVTKVSVSDLTSGALDGIGIFDTLMKTVKLHLVNEQVQGRITGAEYTKAYIAMVSQSMQTAAQILLGREQAYWQGVLTQVQAQNAEVDGRTARVALETAKATLAQTHSQAVISNKMNSAQYSLTKLQLAVGDQDFQLKGEQLATATYNLQTLLPSQNSLISEQIEAARAQTLDTRTDGAAVVGSIGKQKDLYTQQIDSYQKDAAYKVGKIYSDSWLTQKTLDEALVAPTELTNATVQTVLSKLRTDLGLV